MTEPRAPSSKIEMRALNARTTATVRETIGKNDIAETMGRIFRDVTAAIAKQGIEASGAPFGRYHSLGTTIDLEAGLPVAGAIVVDGDVKPSQLPGGPAAIAVHVGPYESLKATYDAIEAWMQSTGRPQAGGPWEVYLTDPSVEPDPSKWLTQVIWPLKLS